MQCKLYECIRIINKINFLNNRKIDKNDLIWQYITNVDMKTTNLYNSNNTSPNSAFYLKEIEYDFGK